MTLDAARPDDLGSSPRGLADLAYVATLAVLLVTLITWAIVSLGPDPSVPTTSSDVFPAHLISTLLEPRDRMVLIGWWLSVPTLVALVWVCARLPRRRGRLLGETLVLGGSVVVAVASALSFEKTDPGLAPWIPRLQPWELTLGVVATILIVATLLVRGRWLRRVSSAVLVLVTLSFLLPALVQTPTSIVEPSHASYTLDELMAPAAGQVPLVNYFPQYTNLLGLPIAPWIRSWPDHALAITLGWVLVLQIVSIVGAVLVAAMVGGRRTVPLALLVVSAPVIFATAGGFYPASYFAAVPIRTVLPVVTIVAALAAFGRRADLSTREITWRAAVVGTLAGLAALNNPDHGLPVAGAIGAAMLLVLTEWRDRVVAAVVCGSAVLVPFLVYTVVTTLTGESPNWSKLFLFPQMFGTVGYGNVAMPAFGPHVGVVAFFAAAAVVGILLLTRRRESGTWRMQGLALTLCGVWSLLTLPYYMGRSLPPQLLFGYAVQVGLVCAALVPLVLRGLTSLRSGQVRLTVAVATSMTLTLLALGAVVGSLASAPTPAASLERINADGLGLWHFDVLAVESALQSPSGDDLRQLREEGLLGQMVDGSSFAELSTGVPSVNVTNHPVNFGIAVGMLRLQCLEMAERRVTAVIMPSWLTANVAAVAECHRAFVVKPAYRAVAEGFVLVDVRQSAMRLPSASQ